jgi:hypothetical protein
MLFLLEIKPFLLLTFGSFVQCNGKCFILKGCINHEREVERWQNAPIVEKTLKQPRNHGKWLANQTKLEKELN